METIGDVKDLAVKIHRDEVFHRLCITPKAASYKTAKMEYEELELLILKMAVPRILYRFVDFHSGKGAVNSPYGAFCLVMTIGERISSYSSELFAQGDYLKGMLVDAMADSCLFDLEETAARLVESQCRERNLGVSKRREAPQDLMPENLVLIQNWLEAYERVGITLTKGFMFSPVKTNGYLYELTDECHEMNIRHDCGKCDKKDCMMRMHTVR